jgi:hypothetical protein
MDKIAQRSALDDEPKRQFAWLTRIQRDAGLYFFGIGTTAVRGLS